MISGQPLATVLSERLFEPLGMVDTAFEVPAGKRPRLAEMYGRPDLILPEVKFRGDFAAWQAGVNERIGVSTTYPVDAPHTFVRGGHGLFGTIGDYFRFAQMLANGGKLDGTRISRPQDAGAHAREPPAGRRSFRSRSAAFRCRATASASVRGSPWMSP